MEADRRKILKMLAEQLGSQAALARKINKSPQQVGQILNGYRNMGDKLAREIEVKLELKPGTLTMPSGQGGRVPMLSPHARDAASHDSYMGGDAATMRKRTDKELDFAMRYLPKWLLSAADDEKVWMLRKLKEFVPGLEAAMMKAKLQED